jgi:hypothetical protein
MKTFREGLVDQNQSVEMKAVQNWILRFICGIMPAQKVAGNREDHFTRQLVTQQDLSNRSRSAHVCPFVEHSIGIDFFWIEESLLTQQVDIESLLLSQIAHFLNSPDQYYPSSTGNPAETPALWKTYITIFPNIKHPTGACKLFETIHKNLKPSFYAAGLALGQFYFGCPQPAIYNPTWTGRTLSSPYPAFAMRYLVRNDKLFTPKPGILHQMFQHYFPKA